MVKLYSRLHTANINFKKPVFSISLLLFLALHTGLNVNAQCDVNPVANQVVCNNTATTAVNFTGTATTFNWTNNTSSIGLAASGTGNIPSFTALNTTATAVTATITVTPSTGACTGTPISFTITVNPSPFVIVTPNATCGGPCNSMTASGADSYIWTPLAGLFTNCPPTQPYVGNDLATVYTAPTNANTYTVTGINSTTGCLKSVFAVPNYTPAAPVVIPPSVNMCLGDPAVKLQVVPQTGSTQFCSAAANIQVPDNNPSGASSSISVAGIPAGCIITGMSVSINMQHTRAGNMVFILKAPNGQIINLDYYLGATGGSGSTTGFTNTIISSIGTTDLSAGVNPYTGTFKADAQTTPAGGFGAAGPTGMLPTTANWSSLMPGPINGNWTLGFYDGVTGDVGTLTFWCLNFNYSCGSILPATPAIWSPPNGLYLDPGCTVPYQTGTPTNIVWTRPVPTGIYPYQVTTQSVPGPPVAFTNPAAISIPVGGVATTYPANLTVSGLPATGVRVSSVVLNGVSHTRSNDIDVLLQSPSGQNVILMSDVGGVNAINATYTFMDWAPYMSLTTANPTGTYRPDNAGQPDDFPPPGPGSIIQNPTLSTFTGNSNGTWKLFVVDDDGTGDQGAISGGYTINFDIGAPFCTSTPTTVVVTVGQQTTITTQPANQNICFGQSAAFSVVAAGASPLSYQWQVSNTGAGGPYTNVTNAAPYSGGNTGTLTINPATVTMSGQYYRVIINGGASCGGAISVPALLTVNASPVVVISASSTIVLPGMPTTIHSTVTPNPAATYTWYYNGSVLAGATADTLVVDINGLGDYQLAVTDINGCGSGLSNIITITDHFALNLFVYPNPTGGVFQARYYNEVNTISPRTLIVYNNRGDKVITKSFIQTVSYQRQDIDLRPYGKGLYWVALVDDKGKRLAMSRVVLQ